LPRTLDVQISVSRAQTELRTDLSILCVACEDLGFLPDASRVRFYSTIESVEADFAPGSEAHDAASAFFAQSPRPRQMALGEVFLEDQPARLVAPVISAANLASLKLVTDGSMKIVYDDGTSGEEILTGMNFSSVTDVDGIATVINLALGSGSDLEAIAKDLPGGTSVLVIQTITAGDDISVNYAVTHSAGTFVGTLLGLTAAASGTTMEGYSPLGIADELTSIKAAASRAGENIYGWALGASLRETAIQQAAAEWVLPRTGILALTSNSADAKNVSVTTDIGSLLIETGNKRVFLNYHDNAQRYPDVSILAYMLSVDYALKDSTVTAKFKQMPGIETVPVTETEWNILQNKGYNIYAAIGNNSQTYRNGNTIFEGWWLDSVINLDNFIEDLSVGVFNVFLRNKKIPYTNVGQLLLTDACKEIGSKYTYNGTFADREKADTSKKSGISIIPAVQVLPTPISSMSVADRAARVAPPIQMIVQEAGAMHTVSIGVEIVQ